MNLLKESSTKGSLFMPRVLAINSSPFMNQGNTAALLEPFLEGMKAEGAEIDLVYTKKMKVAPCQAELHCWLRTPGQCHQRDDMDNLMPKLAAADVWVLATPVFVDGMSGPMKILLDRIMPLMEPWFVVREGHCRHPLRENTRAGKVVLVSTCGLWEIDNFDPLLLHIQAICRNAQREFAGALLRPHGPVYKMMADKAKGVGDILEAARQAGRQVIQTGRIAPELEKCVSRDLMPRKTYLRIANSSFRRSLGSGSDGQ